MFSSKNFKLLVGAVEPEQPGHRTDTRYLLFAGRDGETETRIRNGGVRYGR